MIHYLLHNELDKRKWDECVKKSHNTLIYAHSWYLDIVSPDWNALVEDDYNAVMPLTYRKKFGINYLCQPHFTQKLGVFSPNLLNTTQVTDFIEMAKKKFSFAEINLNAYNKPDDLKLHDNFELNLELNYDDLKTNYHDNTLRNLAKANKNNLELTDNVTIETLINLFDNDRRLKLPTFDTASYNTLKSLYNKARDMKAAFIKGVRLKTDNEIIAAALFLNDDTKLTFLFSGNSTMGKQNQAMTYLIDSVIHDNSSMSLTLDFEGSDDTGTARFYKGFGAESVKYGSLYHNNMSWLANKVLTLWKKLK